MLEIILIVMSAIQLFLLIAIAGSVAKLVGYLREWSQSPLEPSVESSEEDSQLVDLPEGPLYRMENGELVQVGGPTYDQAVLRGEEEPYSDGVHQRPQNKNWDGIPFSEE